MAQKRSTHRSVSGTKHYSVRNADGTLKDIQSGALRFAGGASSVYSFTLDGGSALTKGKGMRKVTLASIFAALSIAIGLTIYSLNEASAFESSFSYSIFRGVNLGPDISSHTQFGLISPSFADQFSRVAVFGSVVDFRSLEAQKPVDKDAIARYVNEQYDGLPAHDKENLIDTLIRAKEVDEILKGKTASPTMADDEKIMYAREREKMLNHVWEQERAIANEYMKTYKPAAYSDVASKLNKITFRENAIHHCYSTKQCSADQYEEGLSAIDAEKEGLVNELFLAPREVETPKSNYLFENNTKVISRSTNFVKNYLINLFSGKRRVQ